MVAVSWVACLLLCSSAPDPTLVLSTSHAHSLPANSRPENIFYWLQLVLFVMCTFRSEHTISHNVHTHAHAHMTDDFKESPNTRIILLIWRHLWPNKGHCNHFFSDWFEFLPSGSASSMKNGKL